MSDPRDPRAGRAHEGFTQEDHEHFERFMAESVKCSGEAYSHLRDAHECIKRAQKALKHLSGLEPLSGRIEALRRDADVACRHMATVDRQFRTCDFD